MTILNEQTKVNLAINNVWAIIVSVIISSFVVGVFVSNMQSKLDIILANQVELKQEFKTWKTQAETRIGQGELERAVINSKLIAIFKAIGL